MPSPNPSVSLGTLRPDLQTFFEARFSQLSEMMIGTKVFPITSVGTQSGTFGKIPIEQLFRHSQGGERAAGAGYWRDIIQFEKDTFATAEYGFEEKVDNRMAAMYGNYFRAERIAMERALNKLLTRQEMRVAAAFDSAAYTSASMVQAKGNGAWNTSGGTMLKDIENAVQKVYAATGLWCNTLIMSKQAFRKTRDNPQLVDAIRSSGAGNPTKATDVTSQMLAAATDLPNVLVAGGTKNAAGPGAVASLAQVWGNHCIVAVTAQTQDMEEPCVGRTFHWSEDGSRPNGTVESYDEPQNRSTIIRARHETQEKQLYLQLACMILDVV
jgi:hypothetical protein